MKLKTFENGIGKIGKYIWKLASEIGFVGNWNEKHHGVGYIGKLNWK